MACKSEYDAPGIGTISPMSSRYAQDARTNFVKKIGSVLENQGLINREMIPIVQNEGLRVRLDEYLGKVPVRKHERHWIDGGKQLAVFHPVTNLPFFMNISGSKICRLFNRKSTVAEIITQFKREWAHQKSDKILIRDLVRFLLLLEELDLIEFLG